MSRAEWLMAQVDLDPIESHGSMEMSTNHFKSGIGGKGRFMQSDRATESLASKKSSLGKPPIVGGSGKSKDTAQTAKTFESKYTLLDVSEEKMRSFVMD